MMDSTKLRGMAEAILAAIKDKNYPAARDLFYDLILVFLGKYAKEWQDNGRS